MARRIVYFIIDIERLEDWLNKLSFDGNLTSEIKETYDCGTYDNLSYNECYNLFNLKLAKMYNCSEDFQNAYNDNEFPEYNYLRIFDKEEELKLAYSKTPDKTLYSKEKFPPKKIAVPLSVKEESLIVS